MLIVDFNLDIIEKIVNIYYEEYIKQCKFKKTSIYKLFHTNEYFKRILENKYNIVKNEIYYFKKYKKRVNNYNNELIKLESKILRSQYYPSYIIKNVCKTSDNIKRYILKREQFLKLYNRIYYFERRLVNIYHNINLIWNDIFEQENRLKIKTSIGYFKSLYVNYKK